MEEKIQIVRLVKGNNERCNHQPLGNMAEIIRSSKDTTFFLANIGASEDSVPACGRYIIYHILEWLLKTLESTYRSLRPYPKCLVMIYSILSKY